MLAEAAVLRAADQPFVLEPLELDDVGPTELLVRIVGSGMCHTDLAMRHLSPSRPSPLPAVFGHEGAGVVTEVGSQVTSAAVGDHVVLSYDSCGRCTTCLVGQPYYCENFYIYNNSCRRPDGTSGARDSRGEEVAARWGGQSSFADYAVASERNVVVVDKALPLEVLAPFGCAVQTGAGSILNGLGVGLGAKVGIFGVGSVGLCAVMAAAAAGASTIVAVDLSPARRELALELGATAVFDGGDPDLAAALRATVGPLDRVLDTTSVPSVIQAAIASLGLRGVCGLVGVGAGAIPLVGHQLLGRTLTFMIEGNAVPQVFLPQMIRLWQAGHFPIEKLISTYPLDQINDAERDLADGIAVKAVLLPG